MLHPLEQQCILGAVNNGKKGVQRISVQEVRKSYDGHCKEHQCFYRKDGCVIL